MKNLYSYLLTEGKRVLEPWLKGEEEKRNDEKRVLLEEVALETKSEEVLRASKKFVATVEESLRSLGIRYLAVDAVTEAPLTIGRSGGMGVIPFEVGIAFDWLLNVPYIPGSSIKGAMRRHLGTGTKGEKDWFTAFDAYPINSSSGYLLVPDVLTPHYSGNVETELDVSPNPIVYLVVPKGVTFRFLIALEREGKEGEIMEALRKALEKGIGAKTSVGYSYFGLRG